MNQEIYVITKYNRKNVRRYYNTKEEYWVYDFRYARGYDN